MDEIEKCIEAVQNGDTYFSGQLMSKLTVSRQGIAINDIDQLSFAEKKILQLVARQKSTKEKRICCLSPKKRWKVTGVTL